MRILVNATTTVVGGGVQVASAFIAQALGDSLGNDFRFAVAPLVMQNLSETFQRDERILVISPSPARIWTGKSSRNKLLSYEAGFKPDVVFTVFGPAYQNFRAPHVCGFGDPWVTHRSRISTKSLSLYGQAYMHALCRYKRFRLSSKDYYWVETVVAQRGLMRLLNIESSRIRVIPNTYSEVFNNKRNGSVRKKDDGIVNVFCMAAPYPHKNLTIIPQVAKLLRRDSIEKRYKFILTLPEEGDEVRKFWAEAKKNNIMDMIENAGRLKLHECPDWYAKSDIVFLPTLLETFSATYPEAMAMGKPIVTTDLDFAHDICGDAAVYYSPLSPQSAADAIEGVANDTELRDLLIKRGYDRLAGLPGPSEKYRLTMKWIMEVARDACRNNKLYHEEGRV